MTRRDRLGALDAVFLPMETPTQSLHIGSLLVLEGPPPDFERFRAHVGARLACLPIFHRRVMRMPLDLGRPIWVDADGFSATDHVHHATVDSPGAQRDVRSLVTRIMTPRLDADRPLWELWQVDGLDDGRWAVVAKAHHTMVDGRSGADLVQALLTRTPHAPTPGPVVEEARPAPSTVGLVGDLVGWLVRLPYRAIHSVLRALRALWAPREARARIERLRFGLSHVLRPDLPPSVLNGPLGIERIWGWAATDLAAATRIARAASCTVNDVYLAALAGGYRRYLIDRGQGIDSSVLRAIVPVSRRVPGRPLRPGTLASAMFVELPVGLADPADRLSAVRSRTAEQKSHDVAEATAAVVRMADHIPAALLARAARAYGRAGQGRVNVVATNVAGPSEVQFLMGRRLLELVPYVPVAQEIRTSTAMLSYAGRLTVGITGDAAALPDLDELIRAVGREFDDLHTALAPDADAQDGAHVR